MSDEQLIETLEKAADNAPTIAYKMLLKMAAERIIELTKLLDE